MTECLCEGGETTQCPGGAKLLGAGAGRDAAGRQDRPEPEGSGGQMGGGRSVSPKENRAQHQSRGERLEHPDRERQDRPLWVEGGGGRPPATFASDQRVAQASGPGSTQPRPAPGLSNRTSHPPAPRTPTYPGDPSSAPPVCWAPHRAPRRNQPLKTGCEPGGLRAQ